MLDNEKAPQPKLEGGTFDQYEHLNTSMFDCEAAKEALEDAVSKKREAVQVWNERVRAFRTQTDAPIPIGRFKEHPAYADLKSIVQVIFVGVEENEIDGYVSEVLSKVSKDQSGTLLFDGKGRNTFHAWIDAARRARIAASERSDIAGCALADQNVQLGSYLDCIFWEAGPVSQLPVSVAVREAQYG